MEHLRQSVVIYENLDLEIAKEECRTYLAVLEKQTNMEFSYPTK